MNQAHIALALTASSPTSPEPCKCVTQIETLHLHQRPNLNLAQHHRLNRNTIQKPPVIGIHVILQSTLDVTTPFMKLSVTRTILIKLFEQYTS